MEASALHAPPGVSRLRSPAGTPFLRLRSDDQLVELFRAGHEEAFRVIHDRYRARLFAYMRQMLPGGRQDAEDALQDVFIRAYSGLRANDRHVALRAWLYRVAHNRCVDQLRKNMPLLSDEIEATSHDVSTDPSAAVEQRESLRKLVADVQRLPDQQRSALLMREMSGMSYQELADSLDLSVPAIKSLLVRARGGLAAAAEARDTACSSIHEEIVASHERGARPNALTRRHLSECAGCREFREQVRGVSRSLNALVPAGPMLLALKLLGVGSVYSAATYSSGGGAVVASSAVSGAAAAGAGGAAAGSLAAGGAAAGGAAVGGAAVGAGAAGVASGGAIIAGGVSAGHVAAIIAAAAAAGGAVAVSQATPHHHHVTPPSYPAAGLVSTAAQHAISHGYSPAVAVAPVPVTPSSTPAALPESRPALRRPATKHPLKSARPATSAATTSTTTTTPATTITTVATTITSAAGTGTSPAGTGTTPAGTAGTTAARTDSTSATAAQTSSDSATTAGNDSTTASSGAATGSSGTETTSGAGTAPSAG